MKRFMIRKNYPTRWSFGYHNVNCGCFVWLDGSMTKYEVCNGIHYKIKKKNRVSK